MSVKLNESLSTRENNFDLIRFIAALAVIYSHSYDLTANYNQEPLRIFSNGGSSIGEVAVAIFFVTSGFLITQSYNRAQSIHSYFFSRFLRIYPALIFVTLCTVFVIGPVLTSLDLYSYFQDIKTIKYLFNATSIKISFHLPGVFNNPFPRDAVNGSLWSLPYELLCYVLVAIVGAFYKRKYLSLFLLIPFSLAFLPFMPMEKLFVYVFYFLCGSLFYIYRNKVSLNFLIFIVMLSLVCINQGYNSSHILTVLINGVCFSYITIFLATIKNSSLNNFSKYGDFSYGLYIWAFPIQQIIAYKYIYWVTYENFLVSTILTLILSCFSWHVIEKRALRLKKHSSLKLPFFKRKTQYPINEAT